MSSGKDYFPHSDAQLLPWFKNFIEKVQTHAATLGITGAQITGFQTDCDDARTRLEDVTSKKTTLQSVAQAKDTALAGIEKRTRDAVVIIKRNANYTEAIGEDLGVVAADDSAAFQALLTTAKPEFVATILPDKVRLDWAKGHFDGVVVQGKRGSEANFAKLDNDTRSPYEDVRHNVANDTPETRTYRVDPHPVPLAAGHPSPAGRGDRCLEPSLGVRVHSTTRLRRGMGDVLETKIKASSPACHSLPAEHSASRRSGGQEVKGRWKGGVGLKQKNKASSP